MKRKWILIAGGALLLALIVGVSLRGRGGRDAVRVYAEPVVQRDITQTVKASGQIHPRVKVNISAHVIGKIEKLFVRDGDPIRAGDPFLQLERVAFLAARDDSRAGLAMAETELEQSEVALADQRVKLARAERLHADAIASKETLESARLQTSSAELRVKAAREGVTQGRAMLEKAEDDLRKTTIFSPLTGRVIALNAEQGEVVVSGTMNNPAAGSLSSAARAPVARSNTAAPAPTTRSARTGRPGSPSRRRSRIIVNPPSGGRGGPLSSIPI